MRRMPLDSSVIASVGYSPDDRILEVEFQTGRVYHYLGVPPEQHSRLLSADSAGKYFNRVIRDHYETREVTED